MLAQASSSISASPFFAFFDAFQLRLQTVVEGVPYQIFLMTPYILSIAALAVMARRARVPLPPT